MRLRCAQMFKETVVLPVGNIWKEVKVGQDPYFFAAAGDIQALPTVVTGGGDLLVYFYSGAVRGLLIELLDLI